jgi:hypothetical protein
LWFPTNTQKKKGWKNFRSKLSKSVLATVRMRIEGGYQQALKQYLLG